MHVRRPGQRPPGRIGNLGLSVGGYQVSSTLGRTVRLFLVDGTASGLTTAEIMNWTGHVLTGPRSDLSDFLKRSELKRTGIYFLTGPNPQDPDTIQLYIGESDNVGKRLVQHSKGDNKEFWERTCVVTSKDQNITKAHARYLEARLIDIAIKAGSVDVINSTAPDPPALPEADESDMEYFISQITLVLPVLGLQFLRQSKSRREDRPGVTNGDRKPDVKPEFSLYYKKRQIRAKALEIEGELIVLSGSDAAVEWQSKYGAVYKKLRDKLIASGKIESTGRNRMRFADDVAFSSPSAASAVIKGQPDNGRKSWKVVGTNEPYGRWQAGQIEKMSPDTATDNEYDGIDEA